MSYAIAEIEGIGDGYESKLEAKGIKTTDDYLNACADPTGRKHVANDTGISEKLILQWANQADLMRLNGVGKQFAELLEAAGVDTVKELKHRNAANLAEKVKEINDAKNLSRTTPSASQLEEWIEQAKTLPALLTY